MYRLAYNFQRIYIEAKDILIPLVITLPVNLIILLAWNISDPMKWERNVLGAGIEDINRQFEDYYYQLEKNAYDEQAQSLELAAPDTFGSCTAPGSIYFSGALFGFDVLVTMYALIQAYEIRKVSTEYHESIWIGAILAAMLQSWVIGIAILALLDDNPKTKFVVKTAVVFSTCMVTLSLVFVPKFGYMRKSWSADKVAMKKAAAAERYQQKLEKQREQEKKWGRREEAGNNTQRSEKQDERDLSKLPVAPLIEKAYPGIRITQSRSRRSAEVQRMKEQVSLADERNRMLFNRLETLQDTLASHRFDSQMAATNAPSSHEYHNSFRSWCVLALDIDGAFFDVDSSLGVH